MADGIAAAAVVALSASTLRPAVGQAVHLWATWDGGWPATIPWTGVDVEEGTEASVIPREPGLLVIRAGEASLTLHVQAVEAAPVAPVPSLALPVYDVDADACRDRRYPALAGAWLVWCSPSGHVDRARRIGTREDIALSLGVDRPGLGPSALLSASRGLWRLPTPAPDPTLPHVGAEPVGPPATDGVHVALAYPDHVTVFPLSERLRMHTEARPLPWYPTALAWPWAAWVEDGGPTGEDVWMGDPAGKRQPLARTIGSERHIAGDDHYLAWVDEAGVYVQDTTRPERRAYAAESGFSGGLGMWGPVACWEDRGGLLAGTGDIDIYCSDGLSIVRPGNQLAPSRWGPWLIFRENGHLFLATAEALILDEDDPRVVPREGDEGATIAGGYRGAHRDRPVTWAFDWPAAGWVVERAGPTGWSPGEPLPVGRVTVTNPSGDAIRLRPAAPQSAPP